MSDFVHPDNLEKSDLESNKEVVDVTTTDIDHGSVDEVAVAREIQQQNGVIRSLRHAEEWLDAKMGIELQGIDRIPEEKKQPPHIINIFLLWWSLNVHVGVIPLGLLGPLFGLTLGQSVGASFLGICLGALCTAYTGTLGPKVRLTTSRFQGTYANTPTARPSCYCNFSVLVRLVGRQTRLCPQCHHWWRICRCQLCGCGPDPQRLFGLYHEHYRGDYHHRYCFLYSLNLWVPPHPYF